MSAREIESSLLPTSTALSSLFDRDERADLQLAGGDDYELCFTASDEIAASLLDELARDGCAATRIGHIVAEPGVRVRDAAGRQLDFAHAGWQHFAA